MRKEPTQPRQDIPHIANDLHARLKHIRITIDRGLDHGKCGRFRARARQRAINGALEALARGSAPELAGQRRLASLIATTVCAENPEFV
jgi:hypothetical protein